jgi:hypothetical protein
MRLRACMSVAILGTVVYSCGVNNPQDVTGDGWRFFAAFKRPVDLFPEAKLEDILTHLPPIADSDLRAILESPDTVFYDRSSIVPGYQDSFGDGKQLVVGFRPNSIAPIMIDLAVPGGHGKLFVRTGEFHFPFGRTGGVDDAKNTWILDFWKLPRENGKLLPVAYSYREPTVNTRRWEWMFPVGTVFGELIFITDSSGQSHIFEIRTRVRKANSWATDVFRPFLTAEEFANALEHKRKQNTAWVQSASIDRLVAHLRDSRTLVRTKLSAGQFASAFETVEGGVDSLPALEDETLVAQLLHETSFRSARHAVWKQNGALKAFAGSTQASFHIVPRNYSAALFEVSDQFCKRCHENAGRPFKDYYPEVMPYGELWGEDDIFSWHPFDNKAFVDAKGEVVSFNDDNRKFRKDFLDAGLIAPYNAVTHDSVRYQRINHAWKNYRY